MMKYCKVNRVIYACDVGSVRAESFAWARVLPGNSNPTASFDIDGLITSLRQDAESGMSIALGFESPIFMPIPESSEKLNKGRNSEGNRSMFASAGVYVTTLGIHESAWILH